MKKFAFCALLSICVAAIAVTTGNSQQTGMSNEYINNLDTTPKMHHTMMKHDSSMHHTMMKHDSTMHHPMHKKMMKPMKDSTK